MVALLKSKCQAKTNYIRELVKYQLLEIDEDCSDEPWAIRRWNVKESSVLVSAFEEFLLMVIFKGASTSLNY